jgi:hypothetical protein
MLPSSLILFSSFVLADPNLLGNCLTQRIDFRDRTRIFALDGLPSMEYIKNLDVSRYDMTIDYHTDLVRQLSGGGVALTIKESSDPNRNPDAPRISSTRLMLYGKITAVLRAPAVPGIVTTFITMGPHLPDPPLDLTYADQQGGDEIDWEILGGDRYNAQSNVFYRGFREFAVRGGYHAVPTGIDRSQKYTIDWKSDSISFSLNDALQRVYFRNSSEADSNHVPGRKFFPDRAGKVQFAVWSEKTNAWAGGAPTWPDAHKNATAFFEYIDIQCYNDRDEPVPKWPLTADNPDPRPSIRFQPTRGVNAAIPREAAPGFNGIIQDPSLSPSLPVQDRAAPTLIPIMNAEVRVLFSLLAFVASCFVSIL